ncbi:hypothetical protein WAF17_10715 [Bernardetia sp. ABR2-2B]|uniref:hypothetical protein n=1 Tax=Bernardetia sp. ABR2-2B TaxID=3127472 RepID=UPI0030D12729
MNNTEKNTTIIVFLCNISLYIEILRNTCKVGKFFRFVGVGQTQRKEKGNTSLYKEKLQRKSFLLWLDRGTDKNRERKKPNAQRNERLRDFEIKSKNNRTLKKLSKKKSYRTYQQDLPN